MFVQHHRKHDDDIVELPQNIRNFLTSGALLTKHSNSAPPRPHHVFVTPDLKFLVWKDPKKPADESQMMKVYLMKGVEKGRATAQLQRKKK